MYILYEFLETIVRNILIYCYVVNIVVPNRNIPQNIMIIKPSKHLFKGLVVR